MLHFFHQEFSIFGSTTWWRLPAIFSWSMSLLNDSLSTFLSETRHSKFENMLSMSRKMTKRTTETGFLIPASMMTHFYKFRFDFYRNRFIYDVLPLAFYQSKLSGNSMFFDLPFSDQDLWFVVAFVEWTTRAAESRFNLRFQFPPVRSSIDLDDNWMIGEMHADKRWNRLQITQKHTEFTTGAQNRTTIALLLAGAHRNMFF